VSMHSEENLMALKVPLYYCSICLFCVSLFCCRIGALSYCTNNVAFIKCLQDDPEAHLPRVGASLFLSPGGDKFVQFLFCFSRYVLYRVMYKRGQYITKLRCSLVSSVLAYSCSTSVAKSDVM